MCKISHTQSPAPTLFGASRQVLSLLWIVAVFSALFVLGQPRFPAMGVGFTIERSPASPKADTKPLFATRTINSGRAPSVHAATLIELPEGRLRAFWYAGSREGHRDVQIYSAVFDPRAGSWDYERPLFDRQNTQQALYMYVKKIGNPAALRTPTGRVWLFYVHSLWGWSGSSINLAYSDDDGENWSPPRRLVTSPLLNKSTLVRSPPFVFADGTLGVPVYHEFLGKFCELLRLDNEGNIIHKQRLSSGRSSLQPAIVPCSRDSALCLMRPAGYSSPQVLACSTEDGGRSWSEALPLPLETEYSGSAALRLDNGELLMAVRVVDDLFLTFSEDGGQSWHTLHKFDQGSVEARKASKSGASYPCLLRAHDGAYHLLFTLHRQEIRHVQFNQTWLDQQR